MKSPHNRKATILDLSGITTVLSLATALQACRPEPVTAAAAVAEHCVDGAHFSGALYGELAADLDWRGSSLACEGMRRPQGKGARLRFAGPAGDGESRLAFIVALPELDRGETATELRATVTVIEEDRGRFFSNGENPGCWSDVIAQEQSPAATGRYAVSGIVYCLTPLAEQTGSGSVRIGELRYRGRIDWGDGD